MIFLISHLGEIEVIVLEREREREQLLDHHHQGINKRDKYVYF